MIVGDATTPASPGLKVRNVRVYLEGSAEKRGVIEAAFDKNALARITQ